MSLFSNPGFRDVNEETQGVYRSWREGFVLPLLIGILVFGAVALFPGPPHDLDRPHHIEARTTLQQISLRTRMYGRPQGHCVMTVRQEQHGDQGKCLSNGLAQIYAARGADSHVQKHHIRPALPDRRERLLIRRRRSHNDEIRTFFEDCLQPVEHNREVIDEQHTNRV